MSDINTKIVDIDRAMDNLEDIQLKVSDFSTMIKHDIFQLGAAINNRLHQLNRERAELLDFLAMTQDSSSETEPEDEYINDSSEILEIQEKLDDVEQKIDALENLKAKQTMLQDQYFEESTAILQELNGMISGGKRIMATYLMQISKITEPSSHTRSGSRTSFGSELTSSAHSTADYRVVIIDSSKYPQSAEHISACIRMGYPTVLTLNREGADKNRKQSLAGIKTRRSDGFDREIGRAHV